MGAVISDEEGDLILPVEVLGVLCSMWPPKRIVRSAPIRGYYPSVKCSGPCWVKLANGISSSWGQRNISVCI